MSSRPGSRNGSALDSSTKRRGPWWSELERLSETRWTLAESTDGGHGWAGERRSKRPDQNRLGMNDPTTGLLSRGPQVQVLTFDPSTSSGSPRAGSRGDRLWSPRACRGVPGAPVRKVVHATNSRARPRGRDRFFTTISTSWPSRTTNRTRRSSEKPDSRPHRRADTLG